MTPDEYWRGDPYLVQCYHKAQQRKLQQRNQEMWIQGAYFYAALNAVAPVLRAFAKNGTSAAPYLQEPIPVTSKQIGERREREAEAEYKTNIARIQAWAVGINISKQKQKDGD